MISVDEAQARILALGQPVDMERLPLTEAAGRWSAEDVAALRTQPARDLSAMDGYAIRHADLPGPWRVAGESAAGKPWEQPLESGTAVRIFTGAAMPPDSDTVVIQENVEREGDSIRLSGNSPNAPGTHIRLAGSDFATGTPLIEAGAQVTSQRIALAAMGGHGTLAVRRRIRVAIIATGDELIAPGSATGTNLLPSSNSPMLAALLRNLPVELSDFGIVRDDRNALTDAFRKAAPFDIIVTTGGASVGDHDLVRPALIDAGAAIDFWKIAMRPGKPLMAGRLGNAITLGLPGNPASAFVTALLFLKPLIAHLSGARDPFPPRIAAELAGPLPAVGERTDFVRARWEQGRLMPLHSSDSGRIVPLAGATMLIVRPRQSPAASIGDRVEAIAIA